MHQQNSIFPTIPACLILLLCSPVKLNDSVAHTPIDNVPSLNPADISHGLPDVIVFVGRLFEYSLASHEIFGQENIKLKVKEVDRDGLPDWIQYNATAQALIGIPTSHDTGDTYIEVTRLCEQSEKCQAVSDVFRLIVKYSSLGATWNSAPLLSKHAVSADAKNMANIPSLSSVDEHGCGDEIVLASLVLCVSVDSLNMQQKMTMLNNMADFLSIPVWRLTVMPTIGQKLRAVERGYQILSAGPGPEGLCDLDKNIELSWKLSCSTVKHIKDFVKVLQHNLNVGRVGKEVGQPIVGWYVASSDSLETVKKRRKRQIPHRTPIPTPVLQPVTPTVVDETLRIQSPVISSTPTLPEASEYVPQIMTRQPVIVEEDTPLIASSPHPEEKPKSWQVEVNELTPSVYPTSSKVMIESSHYTGVDVESFGTSGETDTLESSYTRFIPTTSRVTMIPRASEHYVPDVIDTSFSGSGSSYVDIWPSVIDTSPITRTYDLPDYMSSSFQTVEVTPVVEFFHTSAAVPRAWPEPVIPSSTSQEQIVSETTKMFGHEKTEPTVTRRGQESTSITPEMTDLDLLIPHRPTSTRVYQTSSQHVLSSSESSGDTVVFVIPEHQMPSSSPVQMSSAVFRSQVFVPSRSEMIPSVASGEEESSSSFVSLMSSAVYIPIGSGSGSGSGSGDGMVKEPVVPSKSYPTEKLPTSTEGIEISGSGQMGSGDNVTHPVDHTTPSITEINHPPTVVIPISERLIVPLGMFWEFVIPNDVFFDEEDGDVTNLELSLTFMDGRRVPPEHWLQVDKYRRMLTGLATTSDMGLIFQQVVLVGTDSGGLSANTIINYAFETPASIWQTHQFDIAFAVDYDEFMSNKKTNVDRLLDRISSYYGDGDSSNIRVIDLRRGSLVLSWNNATLNGQECDIKTIRKLFTRLMRRGETLRSNFIKHMQPEFHPLFVEYKLLGECLKFAHDEQVTRVDSDSSLQTAVTNIPVRVDYTEPEIYPSSASGEGSALDRTVQLHSPGSGFFTERVHVMPGVTETATAFGSGGMWTAVVHPVQSSSISPMITEVIAASSVYIHHQLPPHLQPDFVTDPSDATTESSTYREASTPSTAMTTTSAGRNVIPGRQNTETTSSWEDKTLPWVSSVESWTFPVRSTEGIDRAPFLEDPIDYIPANLGKYLEYEIPRGTFYDREDGDTRALQLSLTLLNGQTLPIDFWLQLNKEKQIITGLPLLVDLDVGYHRIALVATDSHGQSVKDAIKLYVNSSSFVRFTHKFIMTFKMNFAAFMNDRTNLNKLLQRISSYFGDTSADNMVVMDVSMGSLVLSWSNTTLNGDVCHNKTIGKIFKRMVRKGEMVRPSFLRHLSPGYELLDVTYELQGACVYIPTTEHIPTTEASTTGSGLSIWAQVVLPVMIALLVLLLVLLIILLINRKRKRQSALQNSEKPVFTNDRNPIIFPEEMEGDEMGLKPKKPIVLPNDRNQSATPSPRTTYYFEDEPQSDHGSNYGTGSRTGSGRRHPKSPPPYYQPHSDPPPYRLPPPYLNNSSDV